MTANEEVQNRVKKVIRPYEDLSTTKNRKLRWHTINRSFKKEADRKRWEDNIPEWTGLALTDTLRDQRIGRNGERWLPGHLRCPYGLPDYGIGEDHDGMAEL